MENTEILAPMASTIIAAIISSIVAALVSFLLNKKTEEGRFQLQLQTIIQLSVQYPYLENRNFANSWAPELVNKEEYQRYENYCTLVFNHMSQLFSCVKKDRHKLENIIDAKNWIRIHKKCWENPSLAHENSDVYDKEFVDLITEYLR